DERPEDPVTQLAQMFDEGHTTLGIGGASAPEPAAPLALAHCGPMGVARVLLSPAAGQVPARLAAAVPAARRAARPAAGRAAAAGLAAAAAPAGAPGPAAPAVPAGQAAAGFRRRRS